MFFSLHLGLSYKCNMSCEHCFVSKEKDNLKLEDVIKTVRRLRERGLFVIYYTFGEPTLSKLLEPVLFEISKMNMVQIVMSNGYAVSEDVAAMFKRADVARVFISIDSPYSEFHDQNRGVPGAFSHALTAIQTLNTFGVPVGIATTVTKRNQMQLNGICSLAKSEGVKLISFLRERTGGKIEGEGFTEYYNFAHKILASHDDEIIFQFHDPTLMGMISDLHKSGKIDDVQYERWYAMNSCHYNSTISIAPNGDVMRCHLSQRVIGNILRNDILEIMHSEVTNNECPICCSQFSW